MRKLQVEIKFYLCNFQLLTHLPAQDTYYIHNTLIPIS